MEKLQKVKVQELCKSLVGWGRNIDCTHTDGTTKWQTYTTFTWNAMVLSKTRPIISPPQKSLGLTRSFGVSHHLWKTHLELTIACWRELSYCEPLVTSCDKELVWYVWQCWNDHVVNSAFSGAWSTTLMAVVTQGKHGTLIELFCRTLLTVDVFKMKWEVWLWS